MSTPFDGLHFGAQLESFSDEGTFRRQLTSTAVQLPTEGELPSLDGANEWLNSEPLTAEGLRGKVVVIDFWTYTCINWLRTLPYVRAWAAKYRDSGLVTIGVHTPEFPFEHDIDNVRRAAREMKVDYPIAIDNDYAVWRAFDNRYWPALYFVDADGQIRHHRFGEGAYHTSEMVIQQLLAQAGARDVGSDLVSPPAPGAEAPADWDDLQSAENYLGYARSEKFADPDRAIFDEPHAYTAPMRLRLNGWALSGNWTVEEGRIVLSEAGGSISYRFHARDLHLVMGPGGQGKSVRFRVTIDGDAPGEAHGVDIDDDGNGTIIEPRMYQLVRQQAPIDDAQFEIEFLDPGVEAYAFTFG